MSEWWAGDTTGRAPGAELDSLRRAVAELLDTDQETWPAHGNAPLAIAAAIARFKIERNQALADLDLANARVAVLREGLEAVRDHPGAGDLYTGGMPHELMDAIDALLASPDDAATKLLAVRDAAAREGPRRRCSICGSEHPAHLPEDRSCPVCGLRHPSPRIATECISALRQENERRQISLEALLSALRNQGLLQKTASGGVVWHVHDCPASFDFAECNYRCRVAREGFALVGTEPYTATEVK